MFLRCQREIATTIENSDGGNFNEIPLSEILTNGPLQGPRQNLIQPV